MCRILRFWLVGHTPTWFMMQLYSVYHSNNHLNININDYLYVGMGRLPAGFSGTMDKSYWTPRSKQNKHPDLSKGQLCGKVWEALTPYPKSPTYTKLNHLPWNSDKEKNMHQIIITKIILRFRQWLIVGLGPGGLDSWHPLMKGIGILRGIPIRIPNHQLTITPPKTNIAPENGWLEY